MDAVDLDGYTYAKVLADLARVNRWTFTASPVLAYLQRAAASMPSFSLLDVGFGHGDILRSVARWAKKREITVQLTGVDLNARSADIARAATPAALDISFRTGDYRDLPANFDFIVSSQVTHHMSDAMIPRFLAWMETVTRRGWMVNDLHRHPLAFYGFMAISNLAVTSEREVVVVEVEDVPGVLADLARKVAEAGINLDLVYIATRNRVVFGAQDLKGLKAVLGKR